MLQAFWGDHVSDRELQLLKFSEGSARGSARWCECSLGIQELGLPEMLQHTWCEPPVNSELANWQFWPNFGKAVKGPNGHGCMHESTQFFGSKREVEARTKPTSATFDSGSCMNQSKTVPPQFEAWLSQAGLDEWGGLQAFPPQARSDRSDPIDLASGACLNHRSKRSNLFVCCVPLFRKMWFLPAILD